jgi:hypothetical protein
MAATEQAAAGGKSNVKNNGVVSPTNNGVAPLRGGITGAGFLPGVSGNVNGRPKGSRELLTLVREATHDGRTLVDFLVQVAEGKPVQGRKPTLADRMRAIELLLDRGWGKTIQRLDADQSPVTVVIWNDGKV